jgi:hypothetical protein
VTIEIPPNVEFLRRNIGFIHALGNFAIGKNFSNESFLHDYGDSTKGTPCWKKSFMLFVITMKIEKTHTNLADK